MHHDIIKLIAVQILNGLGWEIQLQYLQECNLLRFLHWGGKGWEIFALTKISFKRGRSPMRDQIALFL